MHLMKQQTAGWLQRSNVKFNYEIVFIVVEILMHLYRWTGIIELNERTDTQRKVDLTFSFGRDNDF